MPDDITLSLAKAVHTHDASALVSGTLAAELLPDSIDARIQVLSGTDAALATEVLALGEIAAPTDGAWLRKGDGVTAGGVRVGDTSALNADNLTSGTVPEARVASPISTTTPGFRRELVYAANITASYGVLYVATTAQTTTRTFTDPASPLSNGSYAVLSTRGSVTIGGITYPAQPTPIWRMYDNAAELWRTHAVFVPVPATATSTGQAGQIAYDSSFLYICTATNTWRRVAIASW